MNTVCLLVHSFGPDWNISAAAEWITCNLVHEFIVHAICSELAQQLGLWIIMKYIFPEEFL